MVFLGWVAVAVLLLVVMMVYANQSAQVGRSTEDDPIGIALVLGVLFFGTIAVLFRFFFKNAPLRPEVFFDFKSSQVSFRFDRMTSWSEPIDDNSAFMAEGNIIEYRYGLSQAKRGLRLAFTIDENDPDAHQPIIGFVIALNHVLKMNSMFKNMFSDAPAPTEDDNPFA